MIKQNLHTHTIYCDGKDTVEEMVKEAIQKGFAILGFSGHGRCLVDDYSMNVENTNKYEQDVLAVKEKYQQQISIYLGIEQDLYGEKIMYTDLYDYVIGSVHFIKVNDHYLAVDENKEVTNQIIRECGNFLSYAKIYYEEVKKLADMEDVDIIGHLDLLTKFNENEDYISFQDPNYLTLAYDCIHTLIENNKIFEINTGAIARGVRKTPYPYMNLLQYIQKQGGRICLNSDCHNKENLDCYYAEAMHMIRSCGFQSMNILTENGFQEVSIDEFGQ